MISYHMSRLHLPIAWHSGFLKRCSSSLICSAFTRQLVICDIFVVFETHILPANRSLPSRDQLHLSSRSTSTYCSFRRRRCGSTRARRRTGSLFTAANGPPMQTAAVQGALSVRLPRLFGVPPIANAVPDVQHDQRVRHGVPAVELLQYIKRV